MTIYQQFKKSISKIKKHKTQFFLLPVDRNKEIQVSTIQDNVNVLEQNKNIEGGLEELKSQKNEIP